MLVIEKPSSKLLPTLLVVSFFVSFVGSASILYALDPKDQFSATSSQREFEDTAKNSPSTPDDSSKDSTAPRRGSTVQAAVHNDSSQSNPPMNTPSHMADAPKEPTPNAGPTDQSGSSKNQDEDNGSLLGDIVPINLQLPELSTTVQLLGLSSLISIWDI